MLDYSMGEYVIACKRLQWGMSGIREEEDILIL